MTSFRIARTLGVVTIPALLALRAPAPAFGALTFSSSVQRFEADGNGYGSADGVFDLVDEFDDGMLAPNWHVLLGTADESGGQLHLHDPGFSLNFIGLPQEISVVEGEVDVANGEGNFTITSYWDPTLLAPNRQFVFQLYGISPTIEAEGFTVTNYDAATAAGAGAPPGYSISRSRAFPNGEEPLVQDYVPINTTDITGAIVLRMTFDDATDLLSFSFSLDGGATFQSPFTPLQTFKRDPEAEVLLGAAAIPESAPPPGCVGIESAKVVFQRLNQPPGQQGVRATGKLRILPTTPPYFNPLVQGVRVAASSGTGLNVVYDVPAGELGHVACGPRDGWTHRGQTYKYVNISGVFPPSCTTSANGLRKLKFKDDRSRKTLLRFSLTAKPANVAGAATGQPVLALVIGSDDPGNSECGLQQLACTITPKAAHCE